MDSPDWRRDTSPPPPSTPSPGSQHQRPLPAAKSPRSSLPLELELDQSAACFQTICVADPAERAEALESLLQFLRDQGNTEKGKMFLRSQLPRMVRLSCQCPFPDVREAFAELLKFCSEELHMELPRWHGVSAFVDEKELVPLDSDDELTQRLFAEIFVQSGRLPHFLRVLAWHGGFLERFYQTYSLVMTASGPLQLHIRSYIAIMAASQYECLYLVRLMEQDYLANGGDPAWLAGISYIPKKLASLLEINCLLAHQPWLLKKDHIAKVAKGADAWSIGELVHALVIMSTFRFMAGVVFGCGILPELDMNVEETINLEDLRASAKPDIRMSEELAKVVSALTGSKNSSEQDEEDQPQSQRLVFENAAMNEEEGAATKAASEEAPREDKRTAITGENSSAYVQKYVGEFKGHHVDFDVRSKDYSVFHVQYYSWKEHGYALVSRFFADVAPLLDDEFDYIYYMTDRSYAILFVLSSPNQTY
ncbi:Sestrin-2, variant 2 [Balamuthia mandrillaris]